MKKITKWKRSIYLGLGGLAAFSISGCAVTPAPNVTYHYVRVELVPPVYNTGREIMHPAQQLDKSGMCRLTCFSYDADHALYSLSDKVQGKTI